MVHLDGLTWRPGEGVKQNITLNVSESVFIKVSNLYCKVFHILTHCSQTDESARSTSNRTSSACSAGGLNRLLHRPRSP